ncbi:MAG TPA: NDP-sugar synthase, partial [Terrimicrobiaceae bacterium]
LETGGGIKNAEPFIGQDPFIVYSGDVLTNVCLEELIEEHFRQENHVTLALRQTGLASGIALSDSGRITSFKCNDPQLQTYDYANISIWSPKIFAKIPAGVKISFVPILRDWLSKNGRIGGLVLNDHQWFNIGSSAEYLAAHRKIGEISWRPKYIQAPHWPTKIAVNAKVADTAQLLGFYSVGLSSIVEPSARIEDSVVWENATISRGTILRNCVVAEGVVVSGHHEKVDLI